MGVGRDSNPVHAVDHPEHAPNPNDLVEASEFLLQRRELDQSDVPGMLIGFFESDIASHSPRDKLSIGTACPAR